MDIESSEDPVPDCVLNCNFDDEIPDMIPVDDSGAPLYQMIEVKSSSRADPLAEKYHEYYSVYLTESVSAKISSLQQSRFKSSFINDKGTLVS
jgi:hypothetical protein